MHGTQWRSGGGTLSEVIVSIPSAAGSFGSRDFGHLPTNYVVSVPPLKRCLSTPYCISKQGTRFAKFRTQSLTIRASSGESSDNLTPVAPLQLQSPVGQLLTKILQTHPHLLPAAIDQQLDNLQKDKDGKGVETSPSQDLLYKRIAEVQEKERHKTLEEILYCLIVQRFLDNGISMIPKITETSDPTGQVDYWPNQEKKLESIHSPEVFEMILNHLALVLGERAVGALSPVVQISKIKLGKLYAASIMYGYFLRRVDQRYQLERTMKTLPKGFDDDKVIFEGPMPESPFWDPESLIVMQPNDGTELTENTVESQEGKSYKLRSYVMYLDAETLQRYATIRSKEAISLIEKQTQALFGRPDIRVSEDGTIGVENDDVLSISFSGLTMLVLEAAAFGSFMWDSESYIETKYHFINS